MSLPKSTTHHEICGSPHHAWESFGPDAYWKMEDANATSLVDSVRGHTLDLFEFGIGGLAAIMDTGKIDQGVRAIGSGVGTAMWLFHFKPNHVFQIRKRGWTVAFWLKLDGMGPNGTVGFEWGGFSMGVSITVNQTASIPSQRRLGISVGTNAGAVNYVNTNIAALAIGTWYYIVATMDHKSNLLVLVNDSELLNVDTGLVMSDPTGVGFSYLIAGTYDSGDSLDVVFDELGLWFRGPLARAKATEYYNAGVGKRPRGI